MTIEDSNRKKIVSAVKEHFPDHRVSDEHDGKSETLNVYVNDENGRVCTLTFTDLEWQDYHERPSRVLQKIAAAKRTAKP
jgi:hypothetical protein